MSKKEDVDFLIWGANIVGLSLGLEMKKRYPEAKVIIIDEETPEAKYQKELDFMPLYLPPFTEESSPLFHERVFRAAPHRLLDFCHRNKVKCALSGQIVLLKNKEDRVAFQAWKHRLHALDLQTQELSSLEVSRLEPRIRFFEDCLYFPQGGVISRSDLSRALLNHCLNNGIEVIGNLHSPRREGEGEISWGRRTFRFQKCIITKKTINAYFLKNRLQMQLQWHPFLFKFFYWHTPSPVASLRCHLKCFSSKRENMIFNVEHFVSPRGTHYIGPMIEHSGWTAFSLRALYSSVQHFFSQTYMSLKNTHRWIPKKDFSKGILDASDNYFDLFFKDVFVKEKKYYLVPVSIHHKTHDLSWWPDIEQDHTGKILLLKNTGFYMETCLFNLSEEIVRHYL